MISEADSARMEVLIDALPFIQQYRNALFVIKFGGSAMEDQHLVERALRDIIFIEAVGIRPVIVHGGGKLITDRMRAAGLKARFVNGLRVTDSASIQIVEQALDAETNPMLVAKLCGFGGKALGFSGRAVIRARKLPPVEEGKGSNAQLVDVGFVGDVSGLELTEVRDAIDKGMIPVISPIGLDDSGSGATLNVNADVAAGAIAAALKAVKLIYISDVAGLMRDQAAPDSLIPSVNSNQVAQLIRDGIIAGGMIPKVESALGALAEGVGKVHLIDGRVQHSLLIEIFSNLGIGTEIVH